VSGSTVSVRPGRLHRPGQRVVAPDQRTAAVSVVAALDIPGPTRVDGTRHLDRGYEQLVHSLRAAGARIDNAEGVGHD
jgi:UDP-N-acetylglucosamine 1-carboxyvinyltransferase